MVLEKCQRSTVLLILLFIYVSGMSPSVNDRIEISNLLMASEIVSVLQAHQIKQVHLFDADHHMLNALTNTGIEVMVGIPDNQLLGIVWSQVAAEDWVGRNVAPFVPATKITYISLGNDAPSYVSNDARVLVPAMHSLQSALLAARLNSQVKILSSHSIDMKNWVIIFPKGAALYSFQHFANVSRVERKLESTGVFCVANSSADSNALQQGLDWACGPGGANCSAIQPGQPCYEANNLPALASFAYNDYYQKARVKGGTCDFHNTAMLTSNDPSHGSCIFTNSSSVGLQSNTSSGVPPPPFALQPSSYDNVGSGLPSLRAFMFVYLVPVIPVLWFSM